MKKKKVLYFAPHQDDELLSMGLDICRSVKKKWDVHVILCSDGSRSAVRQVLKDGKACTKHEGTHSYELTSEEFVQARDREFTDSCLALGVKPENIHIPDNRAVDGTVSVDQAEEILLHYLQKLGKDALVCTIYTGNGSAQHRDHKAVGKAAENLLNRGVIREVRAFIEPYLYPLIIENAWILPVDPYEEKASEEDAEKLKKAIGAYSLWDPEQQRYAVGYHSVTTEFDDFLANMKGYWLRRQRAADMNTVDRVRWRHRRWRKFSKQRQRYYSMPRCAQPDLGTLQLTRIDAGETEHYRSFCQERNVVLRDKDLQRLKDGSSFWCLSLEDGTVVTTGWMAWKQHFYIGETDYGFRMDNSKSAILFDFNTKPEHRGNGYYGLLLRCMASMAHEPECFVIYTSPINESSARGILKAGFQFDGSLSAEDGSMLRYLKTHGYTGIYRKNQLWGLRIRK